MPNRFRRSSVNAISVAILFGVLGLVMFAALRSPLKDDIAWLLYVARRWLSGRELYVDVIEVNPPLIVWLSAIPLVAAKWLDVGQQYVAMPVFAGLALVCAWWSACLLRPVSAGKLDETARAGPGGNAGRARGIFADRMPVFATIGCVLLIVPAADLGQREHLLAAAFLPYLIVFARTIEGIRTPVPTSLAVGVLAALGCALKPQYGLAFAALELLALRHRIRPWRVAPLAAGVTLAGYVALVAIVCPAYLRRAVPMALALYGATDVTFRALLWDSAPLLAAEGLAIVLWWRARGANTAGPVSADALPNSALANPGLANPGLANPGLANPGLANRSLMMTGMVFALASSAICFLDGKDWFYHRLPATVVTVLVLLLWGASMLADRSRHTLPRWGLAAAGLAVTLFCVAAVQRLQPAVSQAVVPQETTVARLEALIRLHHARTYVAFSEWIALGFPVVNNTGVAWASRFDSMWALKGEAWRATTDPAAAKAWPVARWVAHDFIAGCPDLVVVDNRERANYIGILSTAEPSFARVWSRYRQIVAFDGLTVFKRGKGGCIDPWVAADAPASGPAIR